MDTTLSPSDSIEILNQFTRIYNEKYRKNGSMFENMNVKDPVSTNDRTELFYQYMQNHQEMQGRKQDLVDVYEPDACIEDSETYDVYALIVGSDRKLKYKSLSFISLLFIGYKTMEKETTWSVVKL